eukprot:jgi/Chlat1/8024/Chrsp7S07771
MEGEKRPEEQLIVSIVVKNPAAAGRPDFQTQVPLSLTVAQLKEVFAQQYPGQPEAAQQQLIYAGHVLHNEQMLADLFSTVDTSTPQVVHMVVKLSMATPSSSTAQQASSSVTNAGNAAPIAHSTGTSPAGTVPSRPSQSAASAQVASPSRTQPSAALSQRATEPIIQPSPPPVPPSVLPPSAASAAQAAPGSSAAAAPTAPVPTPSTSAGVPPGSETVPLSPHGAPHPNMSAFFPSFPGMPFPPVPPAASTVDGAPSTSASSSQSGAPSHQFPQLDPAALQQMFLANPYLAQMMMPNPYALAASMFPPPMFPGATAVSQPSTSASSLQSPPPAMMPPPFFPNQMNPFFPFAPMATPFNGMPPNVFPPGYFVGAPMQMAFTVPAHGAAVAAAAPAGQAPAAGVPPAAVGLQQRAGVAGVAHGRVNVPQAPGGAAAGQPRRILLQVRVDLTLMFKLALLVFILSQGGDTSRTRLVVLCVGAVLIYLYHVGMFAGLRRFVARFERPRLPTPRPRAVPSEAAGQDGAAAPVADPPPQGMLASLIREVQLLVIGFFTSLLPGWQGPDEAAPVAEAPRRQPAEQDGREHQD